MSERYRDQSGFDETFREITSEMTELEQLVSTPAVLESYVKLLRKNGFTDDQVIYVLESAGVEGFDISDKGDEL